MLIFRTKYPSHIFPKNLHFNVQVPLISAHLILFQTQVCCLFSVLLAPSSYFGPSIPLISVRAPHYRTKYYVFDFSSFSSESRNYQLSHSQQSQPNVMRLGAQAISFFFTAHVDAGEELNFDIEFQGTRLFPSK